MDAERLSDLYDAALAPSQWISVLGKIKVYVGGQAMVDPAGAPPDHRSPLNQKLFLGCIEVFFLPLSAAYFGLA